MTPIHVPRFYEGCIDEIRQECVWEQRAEVRQESFQSKDGGVAYTYGVGRGERTYYSVPTTPLVGAVQRAVNSYLHELNPTWGWEAMNGVFLNLYESERDHLGWHADDFQGMDHDYPVVVVSMGQAREIWWRENGHKGEVPESQRQLLSDGDLFLMPPGMQFTHQHRIPKGGQRMAPRISLTFRRFKE